MLLVSIKNQYSYVVNSRKTLIKSIIIIIVKHSVTQMCMYNLLSLNQKWIFLSKAEWQGSQCSEASFTITCSCLNLKENNKRKRYHTICASKHYIPSHLLFFRAKEKQKHQILLSTVTLPSK